jgi:glycosyltransferase involved in cell wall biosynthesis
VGIKVSVVVAVYNPGSHIDDCIASLLGQSLPRQEYEVIFVDDGSTDGTGERLDELAQRHEHVHVAHIPNSGWPGKPRNVGTDLARGTYVYYVDNDDWIAPEALERLYAFAEEHDSDVVTGKVVGHGKGVPIQLFRRDRVDLPLVDGLGLLSPHKLFRRSLLVENGIRFPEGRRRLEDHLFVVKAYFAARRISVLASYACYHWMSRDDGGNASMGSWDPEGYFGNMCEVLDVVEANVPPGAERDRLLRHWFRGKCLGRLGGGVFLRYRPAFRDQLVMTLRRVAAERFGEGVRDGLALNLRLRARFLQEGRIDQLRRLAEVEQRVGARVRLEELVPDGPNVVIRLSGHLADRETGEPLSFRRCGDRVLWDLPPDLAAGLTEEDLDWTPVVADARLDVSVRRRADTADFLLPVGPTRLSQVDAGDDRVWLLLQSEARLSVNGGAASAPLTRGLWDVRARVTCTGYSSSVRLGDPRGPKPVTLPERVTTAPSRSLQLYWTVNGNLSVAVDRRPPGRSLSARSVTMQRTLRSLTVTADLPLPTRPAADVSVQLRRADGATVDLPAALTPAPDNGFMRLRTVVPFGPGGVEQGPYKLSLGLGGERLSTDIEFQVYRTGPIDRTLLVSPKPPRQQATERTSGTQPMVMRARRQASRALASAAKRVAP